jgi:hypothetical protein
MFSLSVYPVNCGASPLYTGTNTVANSQLCPHPYSWMSISDGLNLPRRKSAAQHDLKSEVIEN